MNASVSRLETAKPASGTTATSSMPLVSVIIPCYNLARYLGQALDSLLAQTYTNLEILVVDDGSTDNIREVMAPYLTDWRIRYFYQPNQGLGAASARNNGFRQSKGKYLQFLDEDDWLHPEKIARQVAILEKEKACDLVICDYFLFFEADNKFVEVSSDILCATGYTIFEKLMVYCPFPAHAPLVRREAVERAGGFYTGTFCSDYDFWLRLAAHDNTFCFLPEPLVYYRRHSQGMTSLNGQAKIEAENQRNRDRLTEQFPAKVRAAQQKSLEILADTLNLREQALQEVEDELAAAKIRLTELHQEHQKKSDDFYRSELATNQKAGELKSLLEATLQNKYMLEAEIEKLTGPTLPGEPAPTTESKSLEEVEQKTLEILADTLNLRQQALQEVEGALAAAKIRLAELHREHQEKSDDFYRSELATNQKIEELKALLEATFQKNRLLEAEFERLRGPLLPVEPASTKSPESLERVSQEPGI